MDGLALDRECVVFSGYLAAAHPTPYVREKYRIGHRHLPAASAPTDALDRLLVGAARRGPLLARLADAYARHARPTGLLRQKLVLLLAILESSPPAHDQLNSAVAGSVLSILLRVLLVAAATVGALAGGIFLFGPAHAVLWAAGQSRGG